MDKSELRKIIAEELQNINESNVKRLLTSIKVTQFPDKWSVVDIIKRYEQDIWEYYWDELGYKYDYGE